MSAGPMRAAFAVKVDTTHADRNRRPAGGPRRCARDGVVATARLARRIRRPEARFRFSILWVVDRNQRARSFYERAGWSTDGATKAEDYEGTTVHECRYRRPAQR